MQNLSFISTMHLECISRIVAAILIGGIIGYEREYKGMPAGFRTHILVCVGACVTSIISILTFDNVILQVGNNTLLSNVAKVDVGRLGAQVISGVGFLGAGTIIHEKGSIKGLTTAAGLWVVACLGIAVGLGYYFLSFISVGFVSATLIVLKKLEKRIYVKDKKYKLAVTYVEYEEPLEPIEEYFDMNNIKVLGFESCNCNSTGEEEVKVGIYNLNIPEYLDINESIYELRKRASILKIDIAPLVQI